MVTSLFILPTGFPYPPIILITALVVVFYIWTQYRQKMELIKKGESIVQLDSLEKMKLGNLAKGIITISIALGILLANLLDTYTALDSFVSYITMILLFFGLGSLIFYFTVKNQ